MICKLCNEDKLLIEAHIIPKWAFMYLYPNPENKNPLILIGSNRHNKRRPKGVYDKSILCANCDNFLGKFDEYGKKIFLETSTGKYQNSDVAQVISGIDVDKLKIFITSVLWRGSISRIEEFGNLILGPYENKIWKILNLEREGKSSAEFLEEFDILVCRFGSGKYPDLVDKNIQIPLRHRIDGVNFYTLYLPKGYKIFIKIDKRELDISFKKLILQTDELIIPVLADFEHSHEFEFMQKAILKNNEV